MSFHAYLDTIRAKTGKSPDDFELLAQKKGLLRPGTKSGDVVAWLKKDFGLGRGHAVEAFGDGVSVAPTKTYLSILKNKKKFAIVQVTAGRMDVGLELKGVEATDRLESAGRWNTLVTHRVRVSESAQLDATLVSWLRRAYDVA